MLNTYTDTKATAIASAPDRFTEQQARADLGAYEMNGTERPSIRALADKWRWPKTKVQRLLSQIDGGDAGQNGTPTGTAGQPGVVQLSLVPPAAEKPPEDDEPDECDRVCFEQPETWIYANRAGTITIRQCGVSRDREDQIVVLIPDNAEAVALRLRHVAEQIERERE